MGFRFCEKLLEMYRLFFKGEICLDSLRIEIELLFLGCDSDYGGKKESTLGYTSTFMYHQSVMLSACQE